MTASRPASPRTPGPGAPGAPRRRPVGRSLATGAVVLLGAAGLTAIATAPGYTQVRVGLVSGQVWVASSPMGEAVQLDGSTDEVVARVKVAGPGASLRLAQVGTDAVVANRTTGEVSRVSAATQAVVPGSAREAIPRARAGLSLVGGGASAAVFALDSEQGLAAAVPESASAAAEPPVSLAASLDPNSSVVDAEGRFWAVEPSSGDVVRIGSDGRKHQWRGVGSPGSRLVVAGHRLALVDVARQSVRVLDDDAGVERSACVDVRPGSAAGIAVSGSPDGSVVYVVDSSRGVLLISSLASGDCTQAVSLGTRTDKLGAPVTAGSRVFVPDYTSGAVKVVDVARHAVVASPPVLPGGLSGFELFPRDGLVFYNDPGSERAGVIKVDGTFRAIAKFVTSGSAALMPDSTSGASSKVRVKPSTSGLPGSGDRGLGRSGSGPGNGVVLPPAKRSGGNAGQAAEAAGQVQITASAPPYVVGQGVALAVVAGGGGTVKDGVWSFDDGAPDQLGIGVTHTWTAPGTYVVTVRAALDGRPVTTSSTLEVVAAAEAGQPPVEQPPAGQQPSVDPGTTSPPAVVPPADPGVTSPPPSTPAARTPAQPVITSAAVGGDGRSVDLRVTFGPDTPPVGGAASDVATVNWNGGSLQGQAGPGGRSFTVGSLATGSYTFTVTACTATKVCGPASAPQTVVLAAPKQAPAKPTLYGGHGAGSYTPGGFVFNLSIPSAGSGSIASVTVSYTGGASGSKDFAPPTDVPVEMTPDFSGMPTGVDITFVAKICNTDALCATSDPVTNRAYAAPVAPDIQLGRAGQIEMIATWGAVQDPASLAPGASATVTIVDTADSSVVYTCPNVDLATNGICHIGAGTPGRTYRAEYRLQAYPLADTKVSGTVVR